MTDRAGIYSAYIVKDTQHENLVFAPDCDRNAISSSSDHSSLGTRALWGRVDPGD